MSRALARLNHEFKAMTENSDWEFGVELNNDNINEWIIVMQAPQDCLYQDGIFIIEWKIPQAYPFKSPYMKIKGGIEHPSFSKSGHNCIDIFDYDWTPALNIKSWWMAISSEIKDSDNYHGSLNFELAKMEAADPKFYQQYIKHKTSKFCPNML